MTAIQVRSVKYSRPRHHLAILDPLRGEPRSQAMVRALKYPP